MRETPNATPAAPEREPPTMALTLGVIFAQGSAIALLVIALIGVVVALV